MPTVTLIETMDNPAYPLELLQRVIRVSMETLKDSQGSAAATGLKRIWFVCDPTNFDIVVFSRFICRYRATLLNSVFAVSVILFPIFQSKKP